jgi:hypothetical protein
MELWLIACVSVAAGCVAQALGGWRGTAIACLAVFVLGLLCRMT